MNPWFFGWPPFGQNAFSGDLSQWISPHTTWLSPQIELNFAGNRNIEAEVISNVASYGRQLGWLVEAVLAMAGGTRSEALDNLRTLDAKVAVVKAKHLTDVESTAREKLDELRKLDPDALQRLVNSYRQ